jgi:hypothetical protein
MPTPKHPPGADDTVVASILIIESAKEMARLYVAVVRGLGHKPILPTGCCDLAAVDALLVGPDRLGALAMAARLRAHRPDLPIVCASRSGPTREMESLAPMLFLLKPFRLVELTDALEAAVGFE